MFPPACTNAQWTTPLLSIGSYHRQNILVSNYRNGSYLHQNKVELNQKSKSDICTVRTVAGPPRRPQFNTLHMAERSVAAGGCLWSLLCLSDWRFAGSCCLVTMWQMQGQMAACARCRHLVLSPPPPSCLNTGTMGRGELLVPGPQAASLSSLQTLSHMRLMEY